ncbi:MAG: hypothetical protein ACYC3X_16595 [Pirellulaceae bacterium]
MTDASSQPSVAHVPAAPGRRAWLHCVLWLVIFGSGAIVGGGTTLWVVRNRVLVSIRHPEEMPAVLARHLQRMLQLDDQQRVDVEAILQRRQKALQALRRAVQPKIEQELEQAEREISAVLRDDQRTEWQTRFRTLRSRWLPPLPPLLSGTEENRESQVDPAL